MFRIGRLKREDCRSDLLCCTRKSQGQVDCIGKAGCDKSKKLVHEMRMAQNRLSSTLIVFVVNVGS